MVWEGGPEVWESGFFEGAAAERTGVAANIPFISFPSSSQIPGFALSRREYPLS